MGLMGLELFSKSTENGLLDGIVYSEWQFVGHIHKNTVEFGIFKGKSTGECGATSTKQWNIK
jgi:hypothetical protein